LANVLFDVILPSVGQKNCPTHAEFRAKINL
jgi:hypothetical protein